MRITNSKTGKIKAPILLKTILDICFLFLVISFVSALIFSVIALISGESSVPVEVNGSVLTEFTTEILILLFAEIAIAGLTVYTVFLLRRLIRNFFKGKFFTLYQVNSLNKIGSLIIIITLSQGTLSFVGGLLPEGGSRLELGLDASFTSFWFILAIGLFFVYLSELFNNARLLKKENELTI